MTGDARSLLMQILAERAGLPAEAPEQELLSQLGEGDPRLSLLMNYFTRRGDAESEAEPGETDIYPEEDAEVAPPVDLASGWGGVPVQQEAVIREMAVELEQWRMRCDTLASALGACYLCWGTDAACGHCFGKGVTGASAPDARLFRQLIVPAVRRWRQQKDAAGAAKRNSSPR